MDRSKLIGFAACLVVFSLILVLPPRYTNGLWMVYALGMAGLVIISALGGLAWSTWSGYRRRQRAQRNPLDPSLRALVGSDLSWDNCAQAPDFAAEALPAFRFLVESEGFLPARMDPGHCVLTFRRGDVAVAVGLGHYEPGLEATAVVMLMRSPSSMQPVAGDSYGNVTHGLGEGFRGLAFHIQSHLDRIISDLRTAVVQADEALRPPERRAASTFEGSSL